MNEPSWLTEADVIAMHGEQLALFGGPGGLRDANMLGSALGRPINKWHYGVCDLAELAAAYGFGIVQDHPFVDGNKRTGFLAMMTFLRTNRVAFSPDSAQATAAMLDLAAGEIDEPGLARWIRDNWPKDAAGTPAA